MLSKYLILIASIILFTGCASWVESAKKMIGKDTAAKKTKKVAWVSKSQYDELLVRYKNLSDNYETLKKNQVEEKSQFDQIDELSQGIVVEEKSKKAKPVIVKKQASVSSKKTDNVLSVYKKALILKDNGNFSDALSLLQKLEKAPIKQVQVRARYEIAQIYFAQNQFDLALQVYESIINENTYSSKVIDALKGAIASSSKLQLNSKAIRYQSILQDFFGIKG